MFARFNDTARAAAASLSFIALAGLSSTVAATPISNWWMKPGVLPPTSKLTIRTVDVNVRSVTGMVNRETQCEINGAPYPLSSGVIPDTGNFYGIVLDDRRQCALAPLVSIKPKNPATAQELMAEIAARAPNVAAPLQGRGPTGIPQFDQVYLPRHVPGLGMAIPAELTMAYAITVGLEMKAKELGIPAAPAPAPELAEGWENQPGLLPVGPQGNITASRLPNGNCSLRVGNRPAVVMPLNSLVIPDTTRAIFVDQQCKVQPIVTIPVQGNNTVATVGSGATQIPLPPNTNIKPAGGALILAVPETGAIVANGLRLLGAALSGPVGWTIIGTSLVYTGVVAYETWQAKRFSSLTAEEIGYLAMETPDGPYEKYLQRPPTDLAKKLSSQNGPNGRKNGSCTPEEHQELESYKEQYCTGAQMCVPGMDPLTQKALFAKNAMCLKYRLEIMDRCFDGGDSGHKTEAAAALRNMRSCQGIKGYSR